MDLVEDDGRLLFFLLIAESLGDAEHTNQSV